MTREETGSKVPPPSTTAFWEQSNAKVTPYNTTGKSEEIELTAKIDLENLEVQGKLGKSKLAPEVYEQLMKDSEPLWLTNQMVDRPCWFILGGYSFLLIVGVLAFSLDYFKLNENTQRDFLIWDHERTEAWDKMVVGEEYILGGGGSEEDKPLRLTQVTDWNPLMLYRARDGGNLISKDRLIRIRDMEQKMRDHEKWEQVCLAESILDTSCSSQAFISVLNFMPLAGMMEPIESYTDEQLQAGFEAIRTNPQAWPMLSMLFERSDLIEANGGKVTYMRSFMSFGLPLEVNGIRYKSLMDRKSDQADFISDFQMDIYDDWEQFKDDQEVYPQIMSVSITDDMFVDIADQDTFWAVFSVLFVFCFFIFKLRSAFLGGLGILLILLSFTLTQMISEGVFRNTFFSSLHNIVIFIVLGIGADDIFVYTDGYGQTKNITELDGDKKRRVAYAFKRAARATATTSSTTSVAFLANAFSPIMPIQSFGIYAAVIIVVNYVLVIMIFPSVIVWYEDNLEGKCCCPCQEREVNEAQVHEFTKEPEYGPIEKFFGGAWNDFVKKFKYPIILVFVIWVSVSLAFATQLSALTQAEKFFDEDHPLEEIQAIQNSKFMSSGMFEMAIDVYWGVSGIDKSDTSMWDAVYIGDAIMDNKFDLSPPEAQQSLLDFCEDLPSREFVLNKEVTCWFDMFNAYVQSQGKTLPIEDEAEFADTLFTWADEVPEGMQAKAAMLIGFSGKRLAFMKVKAISKGNPLDNYDLKDPWYQKWEAHLEEFRAKAPASMHSITQTAGQYWAFMPSEKAFLSSAFQGMAIAIGFAFIVLLIATANILQASISLLCVVSIMASVLGIMQFKGWEIGSSESLAMVILIGFSVDYVVHLSADFMHSAHHSRHSKMKQAYTEMGVSVLSGAIVTFGSGIFLFGGEMIFFRKFALLITSTIALSFFVSMLLFGALMHTFGPEDGFGSVNCNNNNKKKTISG